MKEFNYDIVSIDYYDRDILSLYDVALRCSHKWCDFSVGFWDAKTGSHSPVRTFTELSHFENYVRGFYDYTIVEIFPSPEGYGIVFYIAKVNSNVK